MATTAQGTTYVESADLVSAYPTASLAVANAIDTKATLAMTQNAQTGTSYTAALTDGYKLVTMSNAAANTFTVAPQASVTWVAGQQLRVLNLGAGTCTVTPGSGVTINGGPLALAQHKGGTLIRTASDVWTFLPFSAGSAPAVVSGTTGSPTTGTGKDGKALYTWTGNGSFTLSTGGRVRLLCVGGGQGGSASIATAGYGGTFDDFEVDLDAGTYTVVVGAAGTYPSGAPGESSVYLSGGFYLLAKYVGGANLGNGGRSPDAAGRYSDISGTPVGFAGAGYNSTNPGTYDAAYGGCPNSATVARANSGGGGSQAGSTGLGAAGRVELLV